MAGGPLARAAREIFAEALDACDAGRATAARVGAAQGRLAVAGEWLDAGDFDDVRVAAVGKAADAMAAAVARALDLSGVAAGARRGLVVAHVESPPRPVPRWADRVVGDHPVPGERSLEAGRRLLALFEGCSERTLAIFLLSGGGSALAESPADPRLGAPELAALGELLVRSSLPIRSINAIRKRVSAIKGGRLAMRAAPAAQVTLVVSDVAPGDAQSVASGPTVPDETSMEEAIEGLERSGFARRAPPALARALAAGSLADTPRPEAFRAVRSLVDVALDCEDAARAAAAAAAARAASVASLGCADGPLEEVVDRHLGALERLAAAAGPGAVCAVVSAGEATLEVTGGGLGGRNQQAVLYALTRAGELCPSARELALLSAGTDGRDGPTDAAGAVAGPEALEEGARLGLDARDHLRRDDAYRFFDPLGALVRTGPTGTNVRDVRVFLARR